MALNERDVNFFRPLWIRLLVTAVLVVWCALEVILSHDQMWITITGIGIVYCIWTFFIAFPRTPPAAAGDTPPADEPPQR